MTDTICTECEVEDDGNLVGDPPRYVGSSIVVLCPLHASAPVLLKALERIIAAENVRGWDAKSMRALVAAYDHAREVVAKAKGE